jgi:two-component system LytT family sensor kinase
VVQRFLEYWLLLLLLLIVDSHRQVEKERNHVLRLQNELQTTQLLALKKQLQPHFLFNTLNTVSALMDVDRKSARTVLARLGTLLRTSLDEERQETVPLHHELEHIGNYLGIETIRFKDRLQVRYRIDPRCEQALVPGMVLQPLVENSIKHGLDASYDGVCITISAQVDDDGRLHLQVGDDGKGCDNVQTALANGGIGVRNVMERLKLLHGADGELHVASKPGQGFHVSIRIPFRTAKRQGDEKHTDHSGGR